MQNLSKVITLLLLLFVVAVSCSETQPAGAAAEDAAQKPLNPNGDSELALLMRAMFEEAQQIRAQIAQGEPISLSLDHAEMLTAHATEPEKAASAEYKAYAQLYLQTMTDLQNADASQLGALYGNMVDNCMACHQAMCPGPIVKIKKLQYEFVN